MLAIYPQRFSSAGLFVGSGHPAERRTSRPGPLIHPRFRPLPPPIIVIGAHRSGTSLVASMLASLGVYMGRQALEYTQASGASPPTEVHGNQEARPFYAVNEQLLSRADSGWNHVEPFLERRDDPSFSTSATRLMQLSTFGPLRWDYLDLMPRKEGTTWGWKDPRNSLTLPYWLRLFPGATVLHVRRELDAVASSLHRRAHDWASLPPPAPTMGRKLRAAMADPVAGMGALARRAGILPPLTPMPDPCLELSHCQRLAHEYLSQCFRHRGRGGYFLEIQYEALVKSPEAQLEALVGFCRTSPSQRQQAAALGLIRRSPAVGHAPAA